MLQKCSRAECSNFAAIIAQDPSPYTPHRTDTVQQSISALTHDPEFVPPTMIQKTTVSMESLWRTKAVVEIVMDSLNPEPVDIIFHLIGFSFLAGAPSTSEIDSS